VICTGSATLGKVDITAAKLMCYIDLMIDFQFSGLIYLKCSFCNNAENFELISYGK